MALIEVLNPIAKRRTGEGTLAARPADLDGKVLGLLSNGKPKAAELIAEIADVLAGKHRLRDVVKLTKGAPLAAGGPMSREIKAELVGRCDVVITASGD